MWVRSKVERPGKQIELISAETLALGPDGRPRPTARTTGWRLQQLDTAELVRAPPPLPRPLSEARSRDLAKDFDRNYVHSLDWRWLTKPLNDGAGESWIKPTTSLVNGETMTPLERLFAVADCANGIGSKIDITKWTFLNNDLVVHVHRIPDGEWVGVRAETNQLRPGRYRDDGGHPVRRDRGRGQHSAVGAGTAAARQTARVRLVAHFPG
jgi:hypothetical protein